jgi:hypothetical protein
MGNVPIQEIEATQSRRMVAEGLGDKAVPDTPSSSPFEWI